MNLWSLPLAFNTLIQRLEHKVSTSPSPSASTAPTLGKDTLTRQAPAAQPAAQIALNSVHGQYIKDPSFANSGNPIGDSRYIVFGNLTHFFLKGFDVAKATDGKPGLAFKSGEIPINVQGLPASENGLWAPQVVVNGDKVQLFYTAGTMGPNGIDWPSFRLHMAEMPLSQFEAEAKSGKGVNFQDKGTLFDDQTTFGGTDRNFAMIDPCYYVNPQGQAYMMYTVVQPAAPGRPWQEFVRARQVNPANPMQAIGPDTPVIDGWSNSEHQGVAEAPDLVTLNGKPTLFVSSRAGDTNQRVLAAPISSQPGRVPDSALKPVLEPGGTPWSSNAVGSTSAMEANGQVFLLYQGMDANHQFSLGFKRIDAP
ncbi:MAG TPA: hypothetical protein V6D47_18145 [Oscillatoriaceae cyanobacterium]